MPVMTPSAFSLANFGNDLQKVHDLQREKEERRMGRKNKN